MAGDPAARRVARIRKWAELTEHYGSDEEAWYAIKSSPEWELTYGLYPFGMLDEGRRGIALDLMIDATPREESLAAPDGAEPRIELDLGGRPMPAVEVLAALRLYARGASIRKAAKESGLGYRLARRVWSWVANGAASWDPGQQKPVTAPDYAFVAEGPKDKRMLRLVRA